MPSGIFIHKLHTEETKQKMSEAHILHPTKHWEGKKLSEEHKAKLSLAMMGIRKGIPCNGTQENNHLWKGDKAGIRAIHQWVSKWKTKGDTCEFCGKSGLVGCQIQWANVDHQYRRVLDDYIHLCYKCHAKYDKEKGFRKRDGIYIPRKQWEEIMTPTVQITSDNLK